MAADDQARANMAKEAVKSFKPVAEEMVTTLKETVGDMKDATRNAFGVVAETSREQLGIVHDFAAAQIKSLSNLFTGPLSASVKGFLGLMDPEDDGNKSDQRTAKATTETAVEAKKAAIVRTKQIGVFERIFNEMRAMRRYFVDDFQDTQEQIKLAVEASTEAIKDVGGGGPDKPKKKGMMEYVKTLLMGGLNLVIGAVGAIPAFMSGIVLGFIKEFSKIIKGVYGWVLKPFKKLGKWLKSEKILGRLRGIFGLIIRPFTRIAEWLKSTKIGAKLFKAFSFMGKGLSKIFKIFGTIGKFIAKNPIIRKAFSLGGRFGKIFGKIFAPIAIIFSIFDAVKGFMQANKIFGENATIVQKIESAIGGIISGLTFGLLDSARIAKLIDTVRQKFMSMFSFVFDGIKTVWSAIVNNTFTVLIKNFMTYVWRNYFEAPITNFFLTIKELFARAIEWIGEKLDFVPGIGTRIKEFGAEMRADVVSSRDMIAQRTKEMNAAKAAKRAGAQTEALAGPGLFQSSPQPINVVQQNNTSAPTVMTQGFDSDDSMWATMMP